MVDHTVGIRRIALPITVSLAVIITTLAVTVVASLMFGKKRSE